MAYRMLLIQKLTHRRCKIVGVAAPQCLGDKKRPLLLHVIIFVCRRSYQRANAATLRPNALHYNGHAQDPDSQIAAGPPLTAEPVAEVVPR